ncbi:hypothetical protein ACE6H2_005541 [Prunus campanulata]
MVFVVDVGTLEERFLVSVMCPLYYLQRNLTRGERLANQADIKSSTIYAFIRLANKTLIIFAFLDTLK